MIKWRPDKRVQESRGELMLFDISWVSRPEGFRKSNRRKEVLCTLCEKEMTRRDSGVCVHCEYARNVGVAYMKFLDGLAADNESVIAKIPRYPSAHRNDALSRQEIEDAYSMHNLHFPDSELAKAIVALADITPIRGRHSDAIPVLNPKNDAFNEVEYYTGLKRTFNQLQKVFDLLRYAIKSQYSEGYRAGQNVLAQLASGQMTVDQLNEYETKRVVK